MNISNQDVNFWGFLLGVLSVILALVAVVIPDIRNKIFKASKTVFPFLPVSFLLSLFLVLVISATAVLHIVDDSFPKPFSIISYLCLGCVAALCYVHFAAPHLARINILAWQGWELLDGHVGALSGWPWTRFRTLYYSRGISSATELYDKHRNPYHIIILDAERLAAINEQTRENLKPLADDARRVPPNLLKRILETNEDRLPPGRMNYGVPVRFGFNEVIYSAGIDYLFQPEQGLPSLAKLNLSNLHDWAKKQGKELRLLLWDWSLPTLSALLAAYKAEELRKEAPEKLYSLADVYKLEGQEIASLCTAIKKDLMLFKGRAFKVAKVEQLETLLTNRKRGVHDVIIGFGSMAFNNRHTDFKALIPREGMLTWVEFASLMDGKGERNAEHAINSVILSLATQTRLMASKAPNGLPATAEAYQNCKLQKSAPLIIRTAEWLEEHPAVPLVMRRLPGAPSNKSTPQAAAIREIWEEAWELVREGLEEP